MPRCQPTAPGRAGAGAERGTSHQRGNRPLLRLVAQLYYIEAKGQAEIARLTGLSVSTVSRMLTQAREAGVVQVRVEEQVDGLTDLGRALAGALRIPVVHVTPVRTESPASAPRLCAVAAAPWVYRRVPHQGVLGIVGGHTIAALVDAIPGTAARPALTVVPLVGGWDPASPDLDANETVRRAAARLGSAHSLLQTPAVVDSASMKRALLNESGIRITTAHWERVVMALLPIGGPPDASPGYWTVMDRLAAADRIRLARAGVVGDLAGHFVTRAGEFVDDPIGTRTIAVPPDMLRRVPDVVAIAAGPHKVDSILGAARTGLISALVTDASTAEVLIQQVR